MTTYHPTSNAAGAQLMRLLENEDKAIAALVEEIRERVLNRSRLASAVLLLDIPPGPDEETEDGTERVARLLTPFTGTGGSNG